MKINYRQAEKTDNSRLAGIIRKVFEEFGAPREGTVYSDPSTDNLYELFKIPNSILWVAEIYNEVVGCCGIYPSDGLTRNCAELVKFYVSRIARGMGIGKELMRKCIDSAKEFNYTQLYLESLPEFTKAIGMYEKQGFERLDQPLGISKHSTCSIWMLKNL